MDETLIFPVELSSPFCTTGTLLQSLGPLNLDIIVYKRMCSVVFKWQFGKRDPQGYSIPTTRLNAQNLIAIVEWL